MRELTILVFSRHTRSKNNQPLEFIQQKLFQGLWELLKSQDYLDLKKKKTEQNLKRIANLFSSLGFSLFHSSHKAPDILTTDIHALHTLRHQVKRRNLSITAGNVLSSLEISEMQMQCTNSCLHLQFFLERWS